MEWGILKRLAIGGLLMVATSACSSSTSSATRSPDPPPPATVTIASTNMEPTLKPGQAIEVTDVAGGRYTPHRGDVVLFKSPSGWFDPGTGAFTEVERVIGVPGDRVACPGPGSPITVNGVALNEPYVYKGDEPSMEPFDVTVPPGRLWVMGDHRDVSEDSRMHERMKPGAGFIPMAIVAELYQGKQTDR